MKLTKYIKYKGLFLLGALTKLIEVILELCLPIFMGIMLDQGIGENNKTIAWMMLFLIIGFALMGYLSTLFSHYLVAKVTQDFARNLRDAVFDKVINFSFEEKGSFQTTSLVNRLNSDVNVAQNGLAMTMRIATRAPFLMVGSLVSLFIISTTIALTLLIGYLALMAVIVLLVYLLVKSYRKLQNNNDTATQIIKENIEGARIIRAFVRSDYEEIRYHEQNSLIAKIQRKLASIASISSPLTTVVLNLILVVMLYISASYINTGQIEQGSILAMINYTSQLIIATIAVLNLILLYTRAYNASSRIKQVLTTPISVLNQGDKTLDDTPIDIEFDNVSFKYQVHNTPTLDNINLKIKQGQKIGIIGLTGSGKSTLLHLIARYLEASTGQIKIQGKDIKDIDLYHLREKVCYVDQRRPMLSGTIRTNLTMGQQISDDDLLEALKIAQFPLNKDDLDNEVYQQGINFSGGQKQRISIARALAKKPQILLLDDIFSALDYQTDQRLRYQLSKLDYKPTIIMVSQRLSSIVDANLIIVIDQNKIVEQGTHKTLYQSSSFYRQLYDTQNSEEGLHV